MASVIPSRRTEAAVVLGAAAAFGLVLGSATYVLHGTTPLLERATNSVSAWIIWTAAAGALIRSRPLAVAAGPLMMLTTCAGYYAASTLGDTFGAAGLGTAAVWTAAGLAGGPLLGWAGWTVRRGGGVARPVAGALIAMVVLGEGLRLGLVLGYWREAGVFLGLGAVLTAALTVHLVRTCAPRPWLCPVLAPVAGLAFHLVEEGVLDHLIGAF